MASFFAPLVNQFRGDNDTVDNTPICRELRAYYTKRKRPLPGWLPPDPKASTPGLVTPAVASQVQPVYTRNIGVGYEGERSKSQLRGLWERDQDGQGSASRSSSAGAGSARPSQMEGGMSAKDKLRSGFSRPQNTQAAHHNHASTTNIGGNYEDGSALPKDRYGRHQNTSGSDRPLGAARSPWESHDDRSDGRQNRTQGLPAGPAAGRRGYM